MPPDQECPDHLAPFALQTAFPSSLAGRDSGDYYEASVALGLAPGRRSHVRHCHTLQRDLGVPFVPLNALTGHRSRPRRLHHPCSTQAAGPAPVSGVFSGGCELPSSGDWDSGNQAFAMSRGSPRAPSLTPGPGLWLAGMLLSPPAFRRWVSHQTQEPPSEFPPAEPGIRQRASWRTGTARPCRRSAGGRGGSG